MRIHTRCGTINNVQFVTFSGDEITIELDCDNATLRLKFSMDSSYHITWFHIDASNPAGSGQQSPVVLPEISLKRLGDASK
jgi:hypothetical protein